MAGKVRSGGAEGKIRERCMSAGNMDEFVRRKRKEMGEILKGRKRGKASKKAI